MFSAILSDVLFDILSDIRFEILSDINSDIPSAIHFDTLSGILYIYINNMLSEILPRIVSAPFRVRVRRDVLWKSIDPHRAGGEKLGIPWEFPGILHGFSYQTWGFHIMTHDMFTRPRCCLISTPCALVATDHQLSAADLTAADRLRGNDLSAAPERSRLLRRCQGATITGDGDIW